MTLNTLYTTFGKATTSKSVAEKGAEYVNLFHEFNEKFVGVSPKNSDNQQNVTVDVRVSVEAAILDEIINFDNLRENLTGKLQLENWIVVTTHQNLYIFNLNKKCNGNLAIRNTISVDVNLVVKVFGEINDDILFNLKLYRWPQLQTLIEQLSCEDGNGIDQQEDAVTFEFCATNTQSDAYDVRQPSTEFIQIKSDNFDSFANVENPILEGESELPSSIIHEGPYVCSECGKEFDQNAKLIVHRKVHQSQICSVCNASFTGRMGRHMQQHLKGKSYECHICGQKYVNQNPLRKHMQLKHLTVRSEFFCDICRDGKVFKTKILLMSHMKNIHHNEKRKHKALPVEQCQVEWVRAQEERIRKKYSIFDESDKSEERTAEASEKNENRSDSNQWIKKCPTCDKEFSTQRQYTIHQRRHDKSKWKVCPICNKRYDNLKRHTNDMHENKRDHVCDVCGAAFKQAYTLKDHIETKHTRKEYSCEICRNGKAYPSRTYLKRHLASVHAKIRPKSVKRRPKLIFKCNLCHKELSSRYTLARHISLNHSDGTENTPQFECQVCKKKYALKSTLAVHEKLHAGKTHICHECGQSFRHPNYLSKHLNTHKDNKKKECTLCDKRYAQNNDLRSHMKKVHGVIVPLQRTAESYIVKTVDQ